MTIDDINDDIETLDNWIASCEADMKAAERKGDYDSFLYYATELGSLELEREQLEAEFWAMAENVQVDCDPMSDPYFNLGSV